MRVLNKARMTRKQKIRRHHRLFKSSLLTPSRVEASAEETIKPKSPNMFDLTVMVRLCRMNWSQWLKQVATARMHQVAVLSRSPSIKNIDLMQDLETLGVQLETVSVEYILFILNINLFLAGGRVYAK